MSQERFTRSDLRMMAVALLLGAIGLVVALRYFSVAFPEASIDFKVSRPEIERRARTFLEQRGFDLTPYRQLALFRYDDNAKTYLERELGLEQANRLMASEISVWRWKVRFYKPPQKEELLVWIDPAGQVIGFEHIIEEKATGARLEKAQAQSLAEVFLRGRMGLDLDQYTLVEDALQKRDHRDDYLFTYERKNFKAKDATWRISAAVYGDQIGKVLPYLKVPEKWTRDYQHLRSGNNSLSLAATLFYVPLLIAMLFIVIPRARQRRIHWKPLLWLSAIVGILAIVQNINNLPIASESFPTSVPYSAFVAAIAILGVIVGALYAGYVLLQAAAGDAVYREFAPDRVAMGTLFSFTGIRTKEFFTSTVVGYSLAGVHIGFVVIFYMVALRLGAWSPAEVRYDNFLNTALPWIYPLTISLFAATNEEFGFRLFAIPFLKKYLKSTWLAVLIPAFVWGFLHSAYPQQPAWIRGVEVGLMGVVYGIVFLRFGILATLVSHYTVDAALIGLFLLRSHDFYFLLAGGLVMDAVLIPLTIAGVLYWQNRRFAAQPELFNAGSGAAAPAAVEAAAPTPAVERAPDRAPSAYLPLAGIKLGVAALAGLAGLALCWLPVEQPLEFLRWNCGASCAEAAAGHYLESKAVQTTSWRRATSLNNLLQGGAAEYVRREGGIGQVNNLWSTRLRSATAGWKVRYYRPLQKEEYNVFVDPNGQVVRYDHLLAENAPGANLTGAQAQLLGAEYLKATYGLDVGGWRLAEGKLEKRDARTDHHLIWEDPQPVAGEARVRAEIDVRGDEVNNYRPVLKVPEEWLRELNKPRIQGIAAVAILLLAMLTVLVLAARLLPEHSFRWGMYVGVAALATGLYLVLRLGSLRSLGQAYNTSEPWSTYVFQQAALLFLTTIGVALLAMLLVLVADLLLGARPLSDLLPSAASSRAGYFRDALILGISATLFYRGMLAAYDWLDARLQAPHLNTNLSLGSALDAYLPGLDAGIGACLGGLALVVLVGIALGVLVKYVRSMAWRVVVAASFLLLMSAVGSLTNSAFLLNGAFTILIAAVAFLAIRHLFRWNLLAYLIALTLIALASDVLFYANQPALRANAMVALVSAVVVVWGLMLILKRADTRLSKSGS